MQVVVREMQTNEKKEVEKLFKRSLGITDRIVFQLAFDSTQKNARKQSGSTLVAEYEGEIVGAVSIRVQLVKNKWTGYIDALVSDKELRGKGIGKSLVDEAISWLENHGCEVIYATADRYNSPSWNIFIHRGFHPYEMPQQFKDYGFSFLRLWFAEFYFIGFGTFFLRKGKDGRQPRETGEEWHLLTAMLGVSVVWWMQLLRSQETLTLAPVFLAVVTVSLLTHEFSQKFMARKLGLETTFKAWGSGILFSWLIALFGGFFPAYGSTYIKQLDWWYNPQKDKTGIIFAIGPLSSLALGFTFWAISNFTANSLLATSAKIGYITSLLTVTFNLIPVQAAGGFIWDGKKILTWNKTVWTALATATIALIMLDALF